MQLKINIQKNTTSKDSENLLHLSSCSHVPVSIENEGSGHIDFVTNDHSSVQLTNSVSDFSKAMIESRNSETFESNQTYEDERENIYTKNILLKENIKEWAIKRYIAQNM